MSNFEKFITTSFYLFWTWRVCSFLYSSYSVSETITPANAGTKIKTFLMMCLMVASMILHAMPLKESPRLSLANTIVSIPSQLHTILFLHQYVGPTIDSARFTVALYIMSFLSVVETLYLIYVDLERME